MFASGCWSVMVRWIGNTTNELVPGGIAIVHIIMAPLQTCMGIILDRTTTGTSA
jgi:hypothetical protein